VENWKGLLDGISNHLYCCSFVVFLTKVLKSSLSMCNYSCKANSGFIVGLTNVVIP
jgi:hypothetical protein